MFTMIIWSWVAVSQVTVTLVPGYATFNACQEQANGINNVAPAGNFSVRAGCIRVG